MTKMSSTAGVPPDGGYGWVITAASSIVYSLSGGVFFAQGNTPYSAKIWTYQL